MAEGEVLQFQCDAGAEGRPKDGEESWQDTHRKRVGARRVSSIISSSSEFPVGTVRETGSRTFFAISWFPLSALKGSQPVLAV